jgi:hypothetical protein
MIALAKSEWGKRRLISFVLTVSMLFASFSLPMTNSANAQEGESDPATPGAEISLPSEGEPAPTVAIDPTPEDSISDETSTSEGSTPTEIPDASVEEVSDSESVPQDAPSIPTLTVSPDGSPTCVRAEGVNDESIAAGSYLDYRCEYSMAFLGEAVALEDIAATFTITTIAPVELAIRYRTNPADELAWSEPVRDEATLHDSDIDPAAVEMMSASADPLDGAATLTFYLRIERDHCSSVEGGLTLLVAGDLYTPARTDVDVTRFEPAVASITLSPVFNQLPTTLPTLVISDLGITPVAFSLSDQQTDGSLRILIENPSFLCSDYQILVAINGPTANAFSLDSVASADGEVITFDSDAGTSLDEFVAIGVLPSGTQAGSFWITVSFDVTVPGGLIAGSFTLTASSSLHLQSD